MTRKLILLLAIVLASFAMMGCDTAPEATTAPATNDTSAVTTQPIRDLIAPQSYVQDYMDTDADHILIDVRTPEEFADGMIVGSVNIPLQEIANRLDEIPRDKPVILYCRSGNRSAQAAQLLSNASFSEIYDLGGIIQWTAAGYQLELPQ